jgi:hypothetical protein
MISTRSPELSSEGHARGRSARSLAGRVFLRRAGLIASPAFMLAALLCAAFAREDVLVNETPSLARMLALPQGVEIPVYQPGNIPLSDGERLAFRAYWMGIPAGQAIVESGADPARPGWLRAEAWLRTSRVADVFYKMRDYVREDFVASPLMAGDMYIRQHDNRRLYEYNVSFDHSARTVRAVEHNRRGTKQRIFKADNPWGPLSGSTVALSLPLETGRTYTFDVFVGRSRFVLSFKVMRRERLLTPIGEVEALRLHPSVVYLSNGRLAQVMQGTTVWISDDARRLPLRLETQAYFGTVRVDLVEVREGHAGRNAAGRKDAVSETRLAGR